MKIFTNRAFERELYKAEDKIRGEFHKERAEEERMRNMWELEKKVDVLTARVAALEDMHGKNADAVVIDANTCTVPTKRL